MTAYAAFELLGSSYRHARPKERRQNVFLIQRDVLTEPCFDSNYLGARCRCVWKVVFQTQPAHPGRLHRCDVLVRFCRWTGRAASVPAVISFWIDGQGLSMPPDARPSIFQLALCKSAFAGSDRSLPPAAESPPEEGTSTSVVVAIVPIITRPRLFGLCRALARLANAPHGGRFVEHVKSPSCRRPV